MGQSHLTLTDSVQMDQSWMTWQLGLSVQLPKSTSVTRAHFLNEFLIFVTAKEDSALFGRKVNVFHTTATLNPYDLVSLSQPQCGIKLSLPTERALSTLAKSHNVGFTMLNRILAKCLDRARRLQNAVPRLVTSHTTAMELCRMGCGFPAVAYRNCFCCFPT